MESKEEARDVWDVTGLESEREGGDAILAFLNTIWTSRWWIVGMSLLVFGVAVTLKLTSDRTYSSVSRFMPESTTGRGASDLVGLAAQFGVAVDAGSSAYSPQFYVDLLRTPAFLRRAVLTEYELSSEGTSERVNLVEHYGIRAETPDRARELAVRELAANIQSSLSVRTGVVELTVTADDPGLAAQINARILELLHEFNTETRKSKAAAEREFVEIRMEEANRELQAREARLVQFLRNNRQWDVSPELRFEHERRQSDVTLQRLLHSSLMQSLQQARIDEIRDTPVLTIVEHPVPPEWPNSRRTIQTGILALVLGGMFGLGLGYARSELQLRLSSNTREAAKLKDNLRGAIPRRGSRSERQKDSAA